MDGDRVMIGPWFAKVRIKLNADQLPSEQRELPSDILAEHGIYLVCVPGTIGPSNHLKKPLKSIRRQPRFARAGAPYSGMWGRQNSNNPKSGGREVAAAGLLRIDALVGN
nr:hypothetical protein [Streptomyces lavendulae]